METSSMESWAGCVAGALHEREYREKLAAAGFAGPEVQVTRTYGQADLQDDNGDSCGGAPETTPAEDLAAAEGALASAFIRATMPA